MATLITKNSSTASSVPTAAQLVQGELAVNVTDKRLFTENSSGTVVELGTNPSTLALPNGSANGVAYLNGSKVLTTGSALTFDGTMLGINTATKIDAYDDLTVYSADAPAIRIREGSVAEMTLAVENTDVARFRSNLNMAWSVGGTLGAPGYSNANEAMRLTSTGLGIGTSSPGYKLDVTSSAFTIGRFVRSGAGASAAIDIVEGSGGYVRLACAGGTSNMSFRPGGTELMLLDSSGNLGLGVTPSASTAKQFEIGYVGQGISSRSGILNWVNGATYNSGWKFTGSTPVSQMELYNGTVAWYLSTNTPSAGTSVSFTQAMTLDASGNLGVGTTSVISGARADIRGANNNDLANMDAQVLTVFDTTSYAQNVGGGIAFGYKFNSSGSYIQRAAVIKAVKENSTDGNYASAMVFGTAPNGGSTVERARITSGGNLLVGATAVPSASVAGFCVTGTSSGNITSSGSSTSAYNHWVFYNGNGLVGYISTSGSTTTYSTSSDYRLKENIQPMTGALAKVAQLKPCTYNWKADGSAGEGFIAHELAEVVPQCVTGKKDAVDADGNPVYQGIDTSFLVATLTAAIQELTARVAALESK